MPASRGVRQYNISRPFGSEHNPPFCRYGAAVYASLIDHHENIDSS